MRQTILTKELEADICQLLLSGSNVIPACKAAGIAPSTFYLWMAQGRGEDAQQHYVEFLEAITFAKGKAQALKELAFIAAATTGKCAERTATGPNYQDLCRLLKRQYPALNQIKYHF